MPSKDITMPQKALNILVKADAIKRDYDTKRTLKRRAVPNQHQVQGLRKC